MPCDVRVVEVVKISTDVNDVDRLAETLEELGITKFEKGENVSYYVSGRTRSDAKLVIRPGRVEVNGKTFAINSDVAFVPNERKGTLEIVTEENGLPKELLNIILSSYANKTIKEEIGQWGGYVIDESYSNDGFSVQVGDQVGKTTFITVNGGVMDIQAFGGSPDVCSPVASGLKAKLLGIKPHAHGTNGEHIHVGGEDHVH